VAALLLGFFFLGAVHHHDGHEACWLCITAAAAVVPMLVLVALPLRVYQAAPISTIPVPSWFLWVVRHHRGPPAIHG
jgi:hypothetical protein